MKTPQNSRRRPHRGWWVASGILAVGCLGAGIWAVPQATAHWDEVTGSSDPSPLSPARASSDPVTDLPDDAPAPRAAEVKAAMAASSRGFSGGSLTAQVTDAKTGDVLYSRDSAKPVMPASNLKILTAYTLLAHQDPSDRYETAGYLGADGKSVTLKAGGDTMLSPDASHPNDVMGRAGMDDLAAQTVRGLKDTGVSGHVPVNLDASRFSGEPVNPHWSPEDVQTGYVTGVHPIALWDHHTQRPSDGEDTSHRPQNAAEDALQAYVAALNEAGRKDGLSFTAGSDGAAAGDKRLGAVESATVMEQARYMLEESDNVLAEVLGRNAAVAAGNKGSDRGAIDTVTKTLEDAGVSTQGLSMADLCGLSPDNRVTPVTLAQTVAKAASAQDARANLVSELPIAGGTGTLASRFDDADETAGIGYARAKTGTLLKVSSLTGVTTTAQGRLIAYSFVVNDVTDIEAAKNVMDRSVAALTES